MWNDIPQVIRDAVALTNQIGERFLWVDTLCIEQDAISKHTALQLMSEIYNSATLTLMACIGKTAHDSLLPDKFFTVPQAAGDVHWRPDRVTRPSVKQRQDIMDRMMQTHYSTRGWTYQERLLSRRRIIFLETDVMFQCRSDMFTPNGEGKVSVSWEKRRQLMDYEEAERYQDYSIELRWRRQHYHEDMIQEWPAGLAPNRWEEGFLFWAKLMEEYSSKDLTYSCDVLQACAGILQALSKHTSWTFVQGMPLQALELSLLWTPVDDIQHRVSTDVAMRIFPSWSWAAWIGSFSYDLARKPQAHGCIREFVSRLEHVVLGRLALQNPDDRADELQPLLYDRRIDWPRLIGKEVCPIGCKLRSCQRLAGGLEETAWFAKTVACTSDGLDQDYYEEDTSWESDNIDSMARHDRQLLQDQLCVDHLSIWLSENNPWRRDQAGYWLLKDPPLGDDSRNWLVGNAHRKTVERSGRPNGRTEHSTRVETVIEDKPGMILQFYAQTLPTSCLRATDCRPLGKTITLEIDSVDSTNPSGTAHATSNNVLLMTNTRAICGCIHGISPTDKADLQVRTSMLELVLLSDCRTSTMGLEGLVTTKLPRGPQTELGKDPAAFGTVKCIMLVRWKGAMAERVGVGEVVGSIWDSMSPMKKTVSLC